METAAKVGGKYMRHLANSADMCTFEILFISPFPTVRLKEQIHAESRAG